MKMIVGLGNPGKEYENTRHNIGYIFIDKFANSHNATITKEKFNGLYTEITINNEKIILLKPLSYMNLSGEPLAKYKDYFKVDINDILVISDDLDLTFGKVRLRASGSSGGHNGLKNIELNLHSNEFKRLKIGISHDRTMDTKDYVLGSFSNQEKDIIMNITDKVISILNDFCFISFENLMNKYNNK